MSEFSNASALTLDIGTQFNFDELCKPHYPAIVAYANRLLPGRKQDALDIVQETFLKAFRNWARWTPGNEAPLTAARGWLHTILRNAFFDLVRGAVWRRDLLEENRPFVIEHVYGQEQDHFPAPEVGDGIGDEVRDALGQLDTDQYAVVVLADFQGEQYTTIAQVLAIPLGTVMSRLHRGRKRLGVILEDYARNMYGIERGKSPKKRLAVGTQSEATQVDDGTLDGFDGVFESSESDVTIGTEQSPDDSSTMAMVDVGSSVFLG